MVTASSMTGSAEAGEMVLTEEPLPMLNLMVSAPAVSLASYMAALKVHWLPFLEEVSHLELARSLSAASPVLLTVKVVAAPASPGGSARRNTPSSATSAIHVGLLVVFGRIPYLITLPAVE
jgi:hypothetical protein